MRTDTSIKDRLRQFLFENLMMTALVDDFGDDTSLLHRSIIDSTGIIELVTFLEDAFAIKVEDQEIVPDNMDSLNQLARFVGAKLQRSTPEAA